MSMKKDIETWVAALAHYDNNEFEESIKTFQPIADTSKILFNCGVIRATLGEHASAVHFYQRAVAYDQYLAVAYFQQGVSNFLVGDFEEALANFNDTLLYLRGNNNIDYEQLGLKFKLYSCEVLFNRGLCYIYLQQNDAGMQDLFYASKEKAVQEHDVIDEAIKEKAEGYTVFSIPVGVVFRPSDAKVRNVRTRDYLGKATLVRQQSTDRSHEHRRNVSVDNWSQDDRPAEKLSFAATNLVRPGLSSRSRQQSEPPLQRNVFPPTPPPESEKPSSSRAHVSTARSPSVGRRPEPLELGSAAFERPPRKEYERRGTQRSASERPVHRQIEQRRREATDHTSPSTQGRLFGALAPDGDVNGVDEIHEHQRNSITRRTHHSGYRPPDSIEEEKLDEVLDHGPSAQPLGAAGASGASSGGKRSTTPKIRAKVHFGDDTRFIIISPDIAFVDLTRQIGKKFGIETDLRIRTRDEEGDMITLGDQDDLDMALGMCRDVAGTARTDVGKLELWVQRI